MTTAAQFGFLQEFPRSPSSSLQRTGGANGGQSNLHSEDQFFAEEKHQDKCLWIIGFPKALCNLDQPFDDEWP